MKYQNHCPLNGALYRGKITKIFSISINNIAKYITKCKTILFADDVQIYIECEVTEINDGINMVNEDLKNIEIFCKDYGIEINPEKTKAIIISSKNNVRKLDYDVLPKICINGTDVEYVDCARDLGYQLNRTNTSTDHMKKNSTKGLRCNQHSLSAKNSLATKS